jgi:hypothetical protein
MSQIWSTSKMLWRLTKWLLSGIQRKKRKRTYMFFPTITKSHPSFSNDSGSLNSFFFFLVLCRLAQGCLLKVAHFSAQLEKYDRAIEIFEQVANASLDNQLAKWSLKEYFLKAGLCHMCTGVSTSYISSNIIMKPTTTCANSSLCVFFLRTWWGQRNL